jgi:hypothetical protein
MEKIINNIIPIDSIKLSFPTLHRNYLQFLYDDASPENKNTICNKKPFGDFAYGIENIRSIIKQLKEEGINEYDKILEKTLELINTEDFIPESQIIQYETISLNFLKSKALTSDIPNIYNFIIDNYKHIRLWHNPNHPNGILLNELVNEIFIKLGLNYPKNEEENILVLDTFLRDWKMPIFKSVCKYYNIENIDNNCSSFYHDDIFDDISYIKKYVKFILEQIQE